MSCKKFRIWAAKDAGADVISENTQLEYLSLGAMAKSENARQNFIACNASIDQSNSDCEHTMDQPLTIPPYKQ